MFGLPAPNEFTVIIEVIGIAFALGGIISWKVNKKKKAKLAKAENNEESS